MKRMAAAVLLLLYVISPALAANDSYVVSGTVSGIEEKGTLFVVIVDRQRWDDPTGSETDEGYAQGFSADVDDQESISYSLEDVPPGTYAIRAFIDTNDNEDLDMGMLGPREPWGVYRATGRVVGPPRFEELSFTVDEDVRDADFELH
ncbi:MAG: DUF2141 domain-containing protein [Spirochaetota bacterium]